MNLMSCMDANMILNFYSSNYTIGTIISLLYHCILHITVFTYLESARLAGSNEVQGSVARKSRHFTACKLL